MTDKALVHHLSAPRAKGRPRVSTVILGASRISQLEDNLKALDHKLNTS